MRAILSLIFILLLQAPNAFAGITSTSVRAGDRLEEITLNAAAPLRVHKSFVLENPARLVIDIERVAHGKGVALGKGYNGNILSNIRFGQFDASTSRLVLDLAVNKLSYQYQTDGNQLRIILKNEDTAKALSQKAVTSPKAGQTVDFAVPTPKPTHLAKQALRPIIVIDAGHGGKDSGAVGKRGSIEKRITLNYAQALRQALLKTGRYRVVMTRGDDRYLFLKERVEVARRQQGDAFISLHADSNPRGDARGLSVYTLSEKASDAEAAALARQENKADIIGGMDLSVEDEAVASILIDLAQRETNNKSSVLAETLIASMDKRIPLITNPHRYAGFRVLKAPDIPSVLMEVGFLSNREDEKRIATSAYRNQVIESTIRALDTFFKL